MTAEQNPRLLDPRKTRQMPPRFCALGIMTKAPRAGEVKTRLQPPLSAEEAAALNVCFLRDTATAISRAGELTQGIAIYTPAGGERDYESILPKDFLFLLQRGSDFGDRLSNATADLLQAGFAACCLIDSDSPTVSADVFREAASALRDKADVVLGPTDDGGYYLIGSKKLHCELFQKIDWSTERVLEQTLRRATESGLSVHLLPKFFDVDDPAALRRLSEELLSPSPNHSAPATKTFMETWIARGGREKLFAR